MLCLYALLGDRPSALPNGIRILACGQLYAAVADVDHEPAVEEGALRGHERIVRALANHVDAILPVRFGSVMPDEESLSRLLQRREMEWRPALELVAGREQMTLRLFAEPSTKPEELTEEDGGMGPGSRYLAKKLRERGRPEVAKVLEEIRPLLAPLVKAERIQYQDKPPLLASVYHLIERGEGAHYIQAVDGADSGASSVRVAVSGPWPPYAFGRWEDA